MKNIKISILIMIVVLTASSSIAQNSSQAVLKKYNRTMVFSKTEIIPGSENESSFITDYQMGDDLYYRVYMDSTVGQFLTRWKHIDKASRFKSLDVRIYLDQIYFGEFHKNITTISDDDFLKISDFGSVMCSANVSNDAFSINSEFKSFMSSHSTQLKGNHKLKILVYMFDNQYYYQLYGTGLLNIKSDENAFSRFVSFTGDFHKAHVKQIVFSSKPIIDNPSGSDLITDYHVGEPLYYRLFMDNTLDYYKKKVQNSSSFKQLYCYFYIDGVKTKGDRFKDFSNLNMTDEQYKTLTTIGGIMMSDKAVEDSKELYSLFFAFKNLLMDNNKVLSGTHKIKIELYLYAQGLNQTGEKLGEGEFSLNLGAVSNSNPNLCYTPKAVVSDPALEAKMITAYNNEFAGKSVAKKAYIMYNEWDVVKNDLGAIICKSRSAIMQVKGADGSCAYTEVSFKMDYEGGGKYGNVVYSGLLPGGYTPVLCECGK